MARDATKEILKRARDFAASLDRDDFEAAARFLAEDCAYETGSELLIGREKIIRSYQVNSQLARLTFDEVHFESAVERASDDSVGILYTDRVCLRGKRLTYQTRQIVTFNAALEIDAIVHEPIPAEETKKQVYLREVGVTLDANRLESLDD